MATDNMQPARNLVDEANEAIFAFVNDSKNRRLRCGTGSYSTPFRGSLFGTMDSSEISRELLHRPANVLWMGSNPNVPQSLTQILQNSEDARSLEHFLAQKESGKFSELVWEDGCDSSPRSGWDPIHKHPTRGWGFYREILREVTNINTVAMANYMVWGSGTFDSFLKDLGAVDMPLLLRVLEFSEYLNRLIVRALSPRLIVVPLSLGGSRFLRNHHSSLVAIPNDGEMSRRTVCGGRRSFNYHLSVQKFENRGIHILHIPHPSSIRLSGHDAKTVKSNMVAAIRGIF